MKRQTRNQLVLDLGRGGSTLPPVAAPEELLQALADLLLEAFARQNNHIITNSLAPLPLHAALHHLFASHWFRTDEYIAARA